MGCGKERGYSIGETLMGVYEGNRTSTSEEEEEAA
jgi:hypothetical protein